MVRGKENRAAMMNKQCLNVQKVEEISDPTAYGREVTQLLMHSCAYRVFKMEGSVVLPEICQHSFLLIIQTYCILDGQQKGSTSCAVCRVIIWQSPV